VLVADVFEKFFQLFLKERLGSGVHIKSNDQYDLAGHCFSPRENVSARFRK
jgi:hypothetical protein